LEDGSSNDESFTRHDVEFLGVLAVIEDAVIHRRAGTALDGKPATFQAQDGVQRGDTTVPLSSDVFRGDSPAKGQVRAFNK
jgi:hypothetical protein